jgi:AbrB family looped-hinge helix DNA binding protein
MITARISAKGQVTLPKRVRQALAVEPGQKVIFVVEERGVVVKSLGPSSVRALAGSLRRYARPGPARALVKKEVARAAAQEA